MLPPDALHQLHRGRGALSRREALALLGAAGAMPLLSCAAPAAAPTSAPRSAGPSAAAQATAAPAGGAPPPATLEKMSFRLDFLPAGFHTPFFVAHEQGWYRDQGLDVEIGGSNGSSQAATLVATGNATAAIVDGGAIVRAIASGQPIKCVALCLAKTPLGYAVPDDVNVRTPKDLEGKTYGALTSGAAYQLWPLFAATNGIDTSKITTVNLDAAGIVPALLQRRVDFVDAIAGRLDLFMAEGGRPGRTLLLADYGIEYLGHGLVANVQTIREKPDLVRRFLEATRRGFEFTRTNPDDALEIFNKQGTNERPAAAEAALKAVIPLWASPWGAQTEPQWQKMIELVAATGNLERTPAPADVFTAELLPRA